MKRMLKSNWGIEVLVELEDGDPMGYDYSDEELEEIKRRKMLEYQKMLEAKRLEEERKRAELERAQILRALLTPEARRRLTNLKLIRPELVENIEVQLIQLVQSGRLKPPITDKVLKMILAEIDRRSRREIKIKFMGLK